MISSVEVLLRRIRTQVSRSAWAIRHFQLSSSENRGAEPGLVLIQIDGLSRREMERALEKGEMPFLKSLQEKQTYEVRSLYSGLPSSTPAVQGELFYGVRQAVPGFSYYDGCCERIFSMFEGEDTREVERRLAAQGEPLLRNGTAYADVYGGGSEEAHLCMTQLGWPEMFRDASPWSIFLLAALHLPSLLRTLVLLLIEVVLALVDTIRGLIAKEDFWMELKFVPSRVAVCILMRELVVIRSSIDAMRGFPILHMNFLGYDEQSHRRGPDSAFAHWTLKGIDYAIKRVYHAARRSLLRDYDVWIYSDHGQAKTDSYQKLYGETVQEAVSRVFHQTLSPSKVHRSGVQFHRARMLRTPRHRPETQPPDRPPIVAAMGPLGCVYLETEVSRREKDTLGRRLVSEARVPLVISASGPGRARAWTEEGVFQLPADAARVLERRHPFLAQTADSLVDLAHHDQSGDFLICGYRPRGRSLTFPVENGSHGGVSPEETEAFALLPEDAPWPREIDEPLRIGHLREAAEAFLRGRDSFLSVPRHAPVSTVRTLRMMTYNIHNCGGMDGYVSPHRIARVIEREKPDIIALQEVDVGKARSSLQDQAELLAQYLAMHYRFHPAIQLEEEQYGEAVLSRFPMEVVRAGSLPYRNKGWLNEQRGALWVRIQIGGEQHLNLINTHLGIWPGERRDQAHALLGPLWLGDPDCKDPVILCGDLNSTPNSYACRLVKERLRDVQENLDFRPRATFSGRFPMHRIDHIFVSSGIGVEDVHVPATHLAKLASDHLPLLAVLRVGEK